MLSEASYVYILSGQKLIEMPKTVYCGEILKTSVKQCYQKGYFLSFQTILDARVPKCSPISLHEKCFTKSVSKWP